MASASPSDEHREDQPPRVTDSELDAGLAAALRSELSSSQAPPPAIAWADGALHIPGYQVLEEIGHGGMGVVYAARDQAFERVVALKTILLRLAGNPAMSAHFDREVQITARLQHPGVPPVHTLVTLPDGRPCLVMKRLFGRTLVDELAARPSPAHDLPRFVTIFESICQTVGFAHKQRVIHRDLKSSNIMVGEFGVVYVLDWGLARVLPAASAAETQCESSSGFAPGAAPDTATRAGRAKGTPAYMPPEQAKGQWDLVTEQADVFALGGILCAILTGCPPYTGPDDAILQSAARHDLSDALNRLNNCPGDPELVALCKRCLSANPADRPPNGEAVAAAVAEYRAGREERARLAQVELAATAAAAAEATRRAEAEAHARRDAELREVEHRKRCRAQLAFAFTVLALLGLAGWFRSWVVDRDRERDHTQAAFDADQARLHGERMVEQVKAEAADSRARAGIRDAITRAAELRKKHRFDTAGEVLSHARGLLPAQAPEPLADLRRATDALEFARELDAIRLRRAHCVAVEGISGRLDLASGPSAYRAAFRARGLDVVGGNVDAAVARIQGSEIAVELVAALDDWATYEKDPRVRDRVLAVARAAQPGPWLDRFRDPSVRSDPAKLERLARDADPAGLSPEVLTALADLPGLSAEQAARLLTEGQFAHPHDFLLAFNLAQRRLNEGHPGAVTYFRVAHAARPDNVAVLLSLAVLLENSGDADGAIVCARKVIALAPGIANAHLVLGTALSKKGHASEAITSYQEAIRIDPTFARAHNSLGIALAESGQVGRAVTCFRVALRLDPTHAHAMRNLAKLLGQGGKQEEAIACFRGAVRLNPKFPEAHNDLGVLLSERGALGDAEHHLREALRVDPAHFRAHTNLGNLLLKRQNPQGAEACYRRALELDAKFAPAHNGLGYALELRGDRPGAIAAFRAATRCDAGYDAAHNNLGSLLAAEGDLDGAIRAFREASRIDPGSREYQVNLRLALELKAAVSVAPPPREVTH